MTSWSENIAEYFFQQSEEERQHILKFVRFINERGGFALIPALKQSNVTYKDLKSMFEEFLKHEITVSNSINELVHLALTEKDYATHNFLQ